VVMVASVVWMSPRSNRIPSGHWLRTHAVKLPDQSPKSVASSRKDFFTNRVAETPACQLRDASRGFLPIQAELDNHSCHLSQVTDQLPEMVRIFLP